MAFKDLKLGDYAVNIAEQAVHLSRLEARPTPRNLILRAGAGGRRRPRQVITRISPTSADKAKHACRCRGLGSTGGIAIAGGVPSPCPAASGSGVRHPRISSIEDLERIGDSILDIGRAAASSSSPASASSSTGASPSSRWRAPWLRKGARLTSRSEGISGARVGRVALGEGGRPIWKEGGRAQDRRGDREIDAWNQISRDSCEAIKAPPARKGAT